MARKGRNKKRQQASKRHVSTQADQVARWESMWSPEQEHGDREDDPNNTLMQRPVGICPTCKNTFFKNDAFHYSKIGPIHGWGTFDQTATCRYKKKVQPLNNVCIECNGTIFKGEQAHNVDGGRIHGPGKYNFRGTCVHRHQRDVNNDVHHAARAFFKEDMSVQDIEALIVSVREREFAMSERLQKAQPPVHRGAY